MRIAFYTLGCKLNQSESEALASGFGSRGFSVVRPGENAEIYIVSTCTVTSRAEQKARRMIRKFSRTNPESMIIVTGCYVQLDRALLEGIAENTFFVSQEAKDILLELPGYLELRDAHISDSAGLKETLTAFFRQMEGEEPAEHDPFSFNTEVFEYHSRAFLKVQDGCDNQCAYCRVTLARGDSRSLPLTDIIERARLLEREGYREIVLTGINLTSWQGEYGKQFHDMLYEVLESVKNSRIRLSSLEPETITPELADILSHERLCPHFHISVQSGSDSVLKMMRRKNNREKIIRGTELLRKACPDPYLAADIIVGFPGETEEDFQDSYDLVKDLCFSELHVFPFSPRPGTAALTMKNRVPERVAGERAEKLRALSVFLQEQYISGCSGMVYDFLLEEEISPVQGRFFPEEKGKIWSGTSQNYLRLPIVIPERTEKDGFNPVRGTVLPARVTVLSAGTYASACI